MDWSKQIGRYVLIMLLQVLVFNQLQLWGVCHPYIYVLCLLMMPITLPLSVDMLIGAAAGFIMDIFCNSMGIHMAACVLIMLLRPYLIGRMVNDKDRLNEEISIHSLGFETMLRYTLIMVVVHHMTVFLLAAWSWSHIGFAMLETLVSGLLTIVILLGYNIVEYR